MVVRGRRNTVYVYLHMNDYALNVWSRYCVIQATSRSSEKEEEEVAAPFRMARQENRDLSLRQEETHSQEEEKERHRHWNQHQQRLVWIFIRSHIMYRPIYSSDPR